MLATAPADASPMESREQIVLDTAVPASESVFRSALLLMLGRALAFVATFFIPVALARIFAPAEFGTYKQLFLVFSTVYLIAQLGMATSLYYFLPQAGQQAGRYVANSLLFLGLAGVGCLGIVVSGASKVAQWMNNPSLTAYLPWIGLYIFLMMLSSALEIVMISRKQYSWASAAYAVSDLARAAALILPLLLFRQMEWLLKGAVAIAFLRAILTLFYFRREFRDSFAPDPTVLRRQLAYALPFAASGFVEIFQAGIPQYWVSSLFDPATFAIFAVGCLSIPLVDVMASPTCDVMMVRMQERLAEGRKGAMAEIFRDTTEKLALVFFPLATLAMLGSREIIVLLFTTKYIASAPLFAVWSALILFSAFQVDGVMRVFAQTRFLLAFNVMRLVIMGGLIKWSLSAFHLIGPVLVVLLATLMFKVAALARIKTLLDADFVELLPWRSLARILAAAGCAGAVMVAVKSQLHLTLAPLLTGMVLAYMIAYISLVCGFDLVGPEDKKALAAWARGRSVAISRSLAAGRG